MLSEEQNMTLTVNSIRPLLRTAWKRSSELLKHLFSMVFPNQVMFLSILSPSCKNSYRRLCRSYRLLLHEQFLWSLRSSKQRQQSKPCSEQMKEANACPKPFTAVICGDYIASKYFPAVWMTSKNFTGEQNSAETFWIWGWLLQFTCMSNVCIPMVLNDFKCCCPWDEQLFFMEDCWDWLLIQQA